MPMAARMGLLGAISLAVFSLTGCNMVPRNDLANAQNRTRQLYNQNKTMAMDRQGLINENQRLQQELADMRSRGDLLQQRVDNLQGERGRISNVKNTNPLSDSANRQFQDLADKYPDFEFDPQTGVSKINNEILFPSGSDELGPEAQNLLRDFARILNKGDSAQLNILVVGHTDDQPVGKARTKAMHGDNWYLSCDRAISVVHSLQRNGVKPARMGATGYSMYQPRVAQTSDQARKQNRRVEIFVLAPNASMAGRDPASFQ